MTKPKIFKPTIVGDPAAPVSTQRDVHVPATATEVVQHPDRAPPDKLRVDFRVTEFIRVLEQHGKYVTWRKALLCPCLDKTTGQAKLTCTQCGASGYVYIDPIEIRALMLSFDKKTRIYEKFGMWVEGTTSITVEPQYRLGYRDSIEMQDSVMSFNELLTKANRRGLRAKLPDGVDSARYRIASITRIAKLDSGGALAILEPDLHYSVTKDGWIKWTQAGEAAVPKDTVLSVHYDFHPIYLIISHPHAIRDDVGGSKLPRPRAIALPIQGAAKLEYLHDPNAEVSSAGGS